LPLNARKTALQILNTLDKGHKTLDSILDDIMDKHPETLKREKSLLYALVYGVLRWKGRIDWIIAQYSRTKLNRINSTVLNILRLGIFQIIYLDRIPVSAAVNTSVDLAKRFAAPWVVRYVNAVLRNTVKGVHHITFPSVIDDPVNGLAVTKSFPKWLIIRWLDRFGTIETGTLCDAINDIPPITLRTNTLKTTRKKLLASLSKDVKSIHYTKYAPDGICFISPKISISELTAFKNGWFQVQDEAAQLVTHILNPQPNETVLDACAGRGGKTGHMAQLMKNTGSIIALDRDENRLSKLGSEMTRLGISIVSPKKYDLRLSCPQKAFPMFDRILLDAPCSGLGVLRRNPDTKWTMLPDRLVTSRETQIQLLSNLANLVKPSGVLVYAVCSMEPEENEEVVNRFLKNHEEFVIEKHVDDLTPLARSLMNEKGYLKTYPHLHHMDGFFSVLLKRTK